MTREEKKEELIGLFSAGAIYLGDLIDECFDFGQQHPHWISVEDELPKHRCYINVVGRGIVYQWRYSVLESADVLKNMYGITHWMPLPVPPSGSSEKPNNCKKGGND